MIYLAAGELEGKGGGGLCVICSGGGEKILTSRC